MRGLWHRGSAGYTRVGRELPRLDRGRALIRVALLVDIRPLHVLDLCAQERILQWCLPVSRRHLLLNLLPPQHFLSHFLILVILLCGPTSCTTKETTPATKHNLTPYRLTCGKIIVNHTKTTRQILYSFWVYLLNLTGE